MYHFIFHKVTSWINSNLTEERRNKYFEYLYNIKYHLSYAKNSKNTCSSEIYNFEFGFFKNGKFLIKTPSHEKILCPGDTAIREAVSALDTALMLINHILNLELPQKKIRWTEPNKNILRKKILEMNTQESIKLVEIMDSIFNSIGYKQLQGYRNWVTHRGAPVLEIPEDFMILLPFPKKYLKK